MAAFNCLPFGNQAPRTVNPNANFSYNVINTNIPPPSFMRQTGQIQTNPNFQSTLPPHAPVTVQAPHTPPCFRPSSNFLQSPPPPIGPVINQVRMPSPQWNNNSYQNSQENIGSNLRFNTPPPRFVENRTPNNWSNKSAFNNSNDVTNRTPNNWSNKSAFNNSNDVTNHTPNNWSNNSSFINSNDVTNRSPVNFAGSNLFTNNFMNQRSLNQYNKAESQFSNQINPQSIIGNQASKINEHRNVAPFKQYGAASNNFQGTNTPVLKTNVPDSSIFNNPNAIFNVLSANNLSPSTPIKFDFRNHNFSGTPTHSRESMGDNSPFKRYFEQNHNDSFQNQNKFIGNKGPKLFNSEFNINKNENLIELVTLSDNEDTIKKELTDINGSFTETTVSINGEVNNTNVSNSFLPNQNFSFKNKTFNQTGQNKVNIIC